MKADISTEKHIFDLIREGDSQALATLFKNYYTVLYNYGYTICHDAEITKDSIQELFVYIWKKRDRLSEVNSVRLYLFVSLRRLLIKTLKKNTTEKEKNKLLMAELPGQAFSALDMIILKETAEEKKHRIKNAIEEIPQRMREALYLKTYNNLSYKEIAEVMDISYQVARNYVSQALQHLRKILS